MTILVSTEDLLGELKQLVEQTSQRLIAKQLGVSFQYLNDILQERCGISGRFAKKLGYERVVRWRKVKEQRWTPLSRPKIGVPSLLPVRPL